MYGQNAGIPDYACHDGLHGEFSLPRSIEPGTKEHKITEITP